MSGGWAIAAVPLRCMFGGVEQTIEVAGWVNGPLGLDFRTFEDSEGEFTTPGYVLTHVPSGLIVRQLLTHSLAHAQRIADEMLAGADWSFTKTPGPEHKALILKMMDARPDTIEAGHRCLAPCP